MPRTVSVKLLAEVADYVRNMAVGEKATLAVQERAEGVTAAAEVSGKALGSLGEKAAASGEKARLAARDYNQMGDELRGLDRQIAQTEASILMLSHAFARTGNSGFLKELSDEKRALSDLQSVRKTIEGELPRLAPTLGKQLSELWSQAGEAAGPALGIAAAVSAPFIAATISGAVIGGAGIGGIVGGLLLTKSDPRVASALTAFTGQLKSSLTADASPFVGVWLDGIHAIDQAMNDINFKGIFADAAKFSGPFINGIAHLISSLGIGIADLIHNAGPAVKAIGDGIGGIGDAIGDGLSELSKDGKQGADALQDLFTVVDGGIRLTFGLIDGLTRLYGILEKVNSLTGGNIIDLAQKWGTYSTSVSGATGSVVAQATANALAAGSLDQYGHAILTTGDAIESYTQKVDDAAAAGRSMFDSTTNVAQATADFEKAIKSNGRTLDASTQKGRDNRRALSDLGQTLVDGYDAYVKLNGEGRGSNDVLAKNREAFIRAAEAAGQTKTKAEALATSIGLIPPKKATDFTLNTHDAVGRANAVKDAINAISGKTVTVTVKYAYKTFGKPATAISPYDYRGLASGGPVVGRGPKGVDSELRLLAPGEHVWTAAEVDAAGGQRAMASLRAAVLSHPNWSTSASPAPRMMPLSGGAGTQNIVVEHRTVVDFANADSVMGQAMIKLYRTNPGVRTTTVRALGLKASA